MAIERVGIVGAGTMGSRIAFQCARCGKQVSLYDISSEALDKALEQIRAWNREYLEPEEAERAFGNVKRCGNLAECVGDAELVIENVPENLEIRICDEEGKEVPPGEKGEIVIRGENVMKGYWKNPGATGETIREDWLFTGDMGTMDHDGFLYVLGRFKSLLIADDGEKYSPEGIEETFTDQSETIEQCILHNNQNPYTVALVHPSREALLRYLRSRDLDPGSEEAIESCIKLIDSEIRQYRSGGTFGQMFPQRWIPATIAILDEGFTIENRLMNPTYKIIRPKIEEHYSELFGFLYTPEARNVSNARNVEAMRNLLKE